ncbi:MAG: signal peptidase I [Candidatus Wallbacteria bacterium]|nr:signal peptidase I [Candidatus Wallbacteria bacterium]
MNSLFKSIQAAWGRISDLPGRSIRKMLLFLMSSPVESKNSFSKKDRIATAIGTSLNFVIAPLVFTLILWSTCVQGYVIPSGSMENTLQIGDRLFGNKLAYHTGPVKRGDIVIFKSPVDGKPWVKRVIGLPGDEIEIRNHTLIRNGISVKEPYLKAEMKADYPKITVPSGKLFVLGDNRNNSNDSRYWGFLPERNVRGKGLLIYWPIGRMRMLNESPSSK